MRHGKHTCKLGKTAPHLRCMFANMLKSLVEHERIETTVSKAKELRRHADRLITLAKKNTLASRRQAIGELMISFNALTPKEAKLAKKGDKSVYNADRQIIEKLFGDLSARFATRNGGFTRIIKKGIRVGDNATTCFIEYLPQ